VDEYPPARPWRRGQSGCVGGHRYVRLARRPAIRSDSPVRQCVVRINPAARATRRSLGRVRRCRTPSRRFRRSLSLRPVTALVVSGAVDSRAVTIACFDGMQVRTGDAEESDLSSRRQRVPWSRRHGNASRRRFASPRRRRASSRRASALPAPTSTTTSDTSPGRSVATTATNGFSSRRRPVGTAGSTASTTRSITPRPVPSVGARTWPNRRFGSTNGCVAGFDRIGPDQSRFR
jgi:hypothetical protein